ncbi:MAG: nucleotidyltransferase domain-containing protein [Candidatus Bathyarchaeota archaeon]|nr:nucleotidyltransferase domain-containing protein [Candidatus Bathyarchaeota archaeon]
MRLAKKPLTRAERLEVTYDKKCWRLLDNLRTRATEIMEALERSHIFSTVHGSISRGDVTPKSDIDIFISTPFSSFAVETALEKAALPVSRRILVQATPTYSLKAYVQIDEQRSVAFPLSRLRKAEREFYKFGGEATLEMLRKRERTPGADKRLMLIEPTTDGHVETSIIGYEESVAKLLGVSADTVLDRVRALRRRDRVGRTGLFIECELLPEETFEAVLKKLADENPAVRRRLRTV